MTHGGWASPPGEATARSRGIGPAATSAERGQDRHGDDPWSRMPREWLVRARRGLAGCQRRTTRGRPVKTRAFDPMDVFAVGECVRHRRRRRATGTDLARRRRGRDDAKRVRARRPRQSRPGGPGPSRFVQPGWRGESPTWRQADRRRRHLPARGRYPKGPADEELNHDSGPQGLASESQRRRCQTAKTSSRRVPGSLLLLPGEIAGRRRPAETMARPALAHTRKGPRGNAR